MTHFRVWSPEAKTMEVVIGEQRYPMAQDERGYWQVDLPEVPAEVQYAFSRDGNDLLPDPASPFQPEGVHGLSCRVDHAAFAWQDRGWQAPPLASAILYELHIGTFSPEGTFEGAIPYLDSLVELGITHVELMPVAEFPGSKGWGYDGVDLYAPHHAYGGPRGLKTLINACHQKGLAVVLDVVYNHLGPNGNYLGQYGPYFTSRYMTPWGDAVNLDGPDSDEVRRFFIDNALMWLRDYHFDGLRLDAVHALLDTSAEHFLEQLQVEVGMLERQLGRHLVLIAESDLNDPRLVQRREVGGYGLEAQWSDDFHHALHSVLTGEKDGYYRDFGGLAALAKSLEKAYVYDGQLSPHRRRRHGRPAHGIPAYRFLGYLQNHDQIGNRALGERMSQLLSPERLKIGAALVLTSPFIPMLFQGEEWAARTPFLFFTDHEDPELAIQIREGRRREFAAFGWPADQVPDPQDPETFNRSRLNWDEREQPFHAEMWAWHQKLIHLRKETPALMAAGFDNLSVRYDESQHWMVVERCPIVTVINLGQQEQQIPLGQYGAGKVILSSAPVAAPDQGCICLPAQSVALIQM